MKKALIILALAGAMAAVPAAADWDPGDPAKWVQIPDLTTSGMDVNATAPMTLADDFLCDTTGPITDIHLWGSWKDDLLPAGGAGNVIFHLSILASALISGGGANQVPGPVIWQQEFCPGEFAFRPYAENLQEGWYDPDTGGYIWPGDTVCWQYNFTVPDTNPCTQQGDAAVPATYYLAVSATPCDPAAQFGWKTAVTPVNGRLSAAEPPDLPIEMFYPDGPLENAAFDLAFVIAPEPVSASILGLGAMALLRRRRQSLSNRGRD